MADHAAEIASIETLLNSGATSVTTDGHTTTIDPDSLRQRLKELRSEDDTARARRPLFSQFPLNRAAP
jgi:hypothetical protein